MQQAVLIFPHQLFKKHPALQKKSKVFLIEEFLFFRQFAFHKHKLILHRSTMKCYEQHLIDQKQNVVYIESQNRLADVRSLIQWLQKNQFTSIQLVDPADDWLLRRIQKAATEHSLSLHLTDTPGFLNSQSEGLNFFSDKKRLFQTDFYIDQRKKRKILLDESAKPIGGQWSFDSDNRQRYPKQLKPPSISSQDTDDYLKEAVTYVEKHFPDNPGTSSGPYFFVTNHQAAEQRLDEFLAQRFKDFGIYEDAIVSKENVLNHSVLSPMLNIGLLEPKYILNKTLEYAHENKIPLNSTEGFVRQIIGWREFIRIIYEMKGRSQRTTNYWKFTRKIPDSFYRGATGIPPIDLTIKKLLKTGYCHHIERLMVLGNFMLLCEFDPDEVYRWFMELFIDAYDWVMVPNVYGMTQFADGGLMTTKPYISGSNYLMKMSDYEKGPWQEVWDGLFWRFMHNHRNFFLKNPRLGMLVKTFDKMSEEKRSLHLRNAENYLQTL